MISSNPESYRNTPIWSCKIYRDFVDSVYSRPQNLRYLLSYGLNLVPTAFPSHRNEVDEGRRNIRNVLDKMTSADWPRVKEHVFNDVKTTPL